LRWGVACCGGVLLHVAARRRGACALVCVRVCTRARAHLRLCVRARERA